MIRRLRRAQEGIHFLDILLDETICEGKILVPEELVRDAGGINENFRQSKNMNYCFGLHSSHRLCWKKLVVRNHRTDM